MKIKFYCIYSDYDVERANLLKLACKKMEVEFFPIDQNKFNFLNPPKIDNFSIIYRCSTNALAHTIERFLFTEKTPTFKKTYLRTILKATGFSEMIIFHHYNIPTPKSVPYFPNNNIKKQVEYLGGFPIVIKSLDSKEGRGVMKIKSFAALKSEINNLNKKFGEAIVLKEFIEIGTPAYSYRAVVLNKKVIFAYKNTNISSDDFRSNIDQTKRKREKIELTNKQKNILIKATRVLSVDWAAVDFVIKNKKVCIFEVNSPFNFVPIYKTFKYPIHEKIVKYLINKINA
jgi:hypothetical protein